MTTSPIRCMRIHLYGTQGTGSIFPAREDRRDFQRRAEIDLLKLLFADLAHLTSQSRDISATIEEIIGGPVSHKTLAAYAERFNIPEPWVYGGWTTCVHLETSDGYDIVFDCGSGFRNCARDLQAKWADRPERHLHL